MTEIQPESPRPRRAPRRILIAAAAGAVLVGGGAALAATQPWSPKQERQAMIADAAQRLGVEPQKLDDALTQALLDRIDQAVKDGRLTQQQADAMKARIKAGDFPMFGAGPGGGPGWGRGHHGGPGGPGGPGAMLGAAATYLGVTAAELQQQRQSGKTLEQIAKAKGKSVDGLKQAMRGSVKKALDDAVKNGKLTQAQADQALANIDQRIAHEITENEAEEHHGGFGGGPADGSGGAPVNPWGGSPVAPAASQGI